MKLIFGCCLGWGIVFFKKKIILESLEHILCSIRNIWRDHQKWWKITKMCDFRKIHEKSNPQMKKCQISKNSKIRLKCCMKLIFGCWLGWDIVFLKKIILEPLEHILCSIRNIWWDHQKWWKITKMCGFGWIFQLSTLDWRAHMHVCARLGARKREHKSFQNVGTLGFLLHIFPCSYPS